MKMKLNDTNGSGKNGGVGSAFRNVCVASCQKILAQITAAKEAIFSESFDALKSQERLLRLALNEAEAAAWQTEYPQLVFPALATEKVQAVVAWDAHQRAVRRNNPILGLAA
jgi:hypothetical protein